MRTKPSVSLDPVWWTVVNAGWFGVLVGTLIGIAGLYAAWIFYKRAQPRPSLQTTSDSTLVVGRPEDTVAESLQIRFNSQIVPQVTSTRIGIWNDGTTTFRSADIVPNDPLRFRVEGGKILQVSLDCVSRAVIGVTTDVRGESEVLMAFDFFEPNDAFTVRVLHSASPNDGVMSGTIIGLPSGIQRFRPGLTGARIEHHLDRFFAAFAVIFLVGLTISVWVDHGWRKGILVPLILAAIIGCVVSIIWVLDRLGRRWSKSVPEAILSNSDLRRRLELEKAFQTAAR